VPPPQPAQISDAVAIAPKTLSSPGQRERGKPGLVDGIGGSYLGWEDIIRAACFNGGYKPVSVLSRCNPRCAILNEVDPEPARDPLSRRLFRPRSTVQWRLTLLYGALFLISSAVLLAITYWLFANFAFSYVPKPTVGRHGQPPDPTTVALTIALDHQRSIGLHRLLLESGIALAIMTGASGVLGWVMAGRVLTPLRTITATTEQISETNLHQRLAMPGPRDELRLLADTIDRLLERLEAAFAAQRQFVANASHELRTPLAMMRTTLDVAIAKPAGVPTQTRELDAELRMDLDQADRLLESFLTLARAQHSPLDKRSLISLEPILTAALNARADRIAGKRLTLELHLAAAHVMGNATLLARMIDNVIENAVHHVQPQGWIALTLTPSGEQHAHVIVDNSGPIFAQEAVTQLTQPFKRLAPDRTGSQSGHGIGLSIASAVATAHDGSLELHARAQGGLRVQITLPALTSADRAAAAS
jgi:signal transduction histidine kinase